MAKANNPMLKRTAPRPAENQTTVEVIEDTDINHDLLSELPPDCTLEKPLSAAEKKRLSELESFISKNLETFYDVGCALREIHDRRLFRETHTNFAAYIKDNFDYQRAHGYRMIDAANVVDNVKKIVKLESVSNWRHSDLIPKNEAQARTLTKYPPEKQCEIWSEAVKTIDNNRITAAHIKKTAATLGLAKVKKAVKQARKAKTKNRSPKMSPNFKTAYHAFLDAINVEREAEWKHTDPKPAIQAVKVILQALEAEL